LGPHDAQVRVLASSATLSDSVVRRGFSPYLGHVQPPFVLGYDFVGRVERVGDEVNGLSVGDVVADVVRFGGNSDVVIRPAAALTVLKNDVDPLAAEVMVMSGMTALQMLTRVARLVAGERVLVVGASGGVGLLAVGLAHNLGASVVLGTASSSKLALVSGQGGVAVDRDGEDLANHVRRHDGVDVIIDAVGGDSLPELGRLLAPKGRLVSFGLAALARGGTQNTPQARHQLSRALVRGLAAIAVINEDPKKLRASSYDVVTEREAHRDFYDDDLRFLTSLVSSGALRPVFSSRTLEQAAETHADIDAGRVCGRLVFSHQRNSRGAP
jgi:NADPH2:quinone reductase